MTGKPRRQTPPPTPKRKASPYERLKRAIADGTLAPGAPLVETALADWCQVSRTPIREALTRLEQDGLVTRSERGLIVRERSHEEVLDIYDVRIVLEGMAARTAADRHTSIDLIHLRRAAADMAATDPHDELAMTTSNGNFHRRLWTAGHNGSLIDLLDRLDFHVARYPRTTLTRPGRWDEALAEHDAIIKAIESRNRQLAEELAREHFTKARGLRLEVLADEQAPLH